MERPVTLDDLQPGDLLRHVKMGTVIKYKYHHWRDEACFLHGTVVDAGSSHFEVGQPFSDRREMWVKS